MFRPYDDWFLPPHRIRRNLPRWESRWEVTTRKTTPLDEERIRKIVREEPADLIPVDVPDAPPEDLS